MFLLPEKKTHTARGLDPAGRAVSRNQCPHRVLLVSMRTCIYKELRAVQMLLQSEGCEVQHGCQSGLLGLQED